MDGLKLKLTPADCGLGRSAAGARWQQIRNIRQRLCVLPKRHAQLIHLPRAECRRKIKFKVVTFDMRWHLAATECTCHEKIVAMIPMCMTETCAVGAGCCACGLSLLWRVSVSAVTRTYKESNLTISPVADIKLWLPVTN
eukprot:4458498-Pleurochrysis_carterae.AAC.1